MACPACGHPLSHWVGPSSAEFEAFLKTLQKPSSSNKEDKYKDGPKPLPNKDEPKHYSPKKEEPKPSSPKIDEPKTSSPKKDVLKPTYPYSSFSTFGLTIVTLLGVMCTIGIFYLFVSYVPYTEFVSYRVFVRFVTTTFIY